jgi:hypothetical protein
MFTECSRCERGFFDRRDCPMCGAPVGAYATGPGLLRDLADGFVRLRDAAYLRVGAIGDQELAAMSPEERQRFFAAADGGIEMGERTAERRDVFVPAPVAVVEEWLHAPEVRAERIADLDGESFAWIDDAERGGRVGYLHEAVDADDVLERSEVRFTDVDGYDRVTGVSLGIWNDDDLVVIGEGAYTFRPGGLIEQMDLRVAGGLHVLGTAGIALKPDPRGSRLLRTVELHASWPVDVAREEGEAVLDAMVEELLAGEIDELQRVVAHAPRRHQPPPPPRAEDAEQVAAAFALLGLARGCRADDAQAAFRQLAMLLHPDRHHGSPAQVRSAAAEQMTRLNDAYRTVSRVLS